MNGYGTIKREGVWERVGTVWLGGRRWDNDYPRRKWGSAEYTALGT